MKNLTKEQFLSKFNESKNVEEMQEKIGVSRATIYKYMKRLNLHFKVKHREKCGRKPLIKI